MPFELPHAPRVYFVAQNPFKLHHVKHVETLAELDALEAGPKVVLCPCACLDHGFARELFARWAPDRRNTVVLTQRAGPRSLATKLRAVPRPMQVGLVWLVRLVRLVWLGWLGWSGWIDGWMDRWLVGWLVG